MAAVTACASSTFAGQALGLSSNDLAAKVNVGEARVVMRKSKSSSSSIWYVLLDVKHCFSFAIWCFDCRVKCGNLSAIVLVRNFEDCQSYFMGSKVFECCDPRFVLLLNFST
jgi:hypothetical protein